MDVNSIWVFLGVNYLFVEIENLGKLIKVCVGGFNKIGRFLFEDM